MLRDIEWLQTNNESEGHGKGRRHYCGSAVDPSFNYLVPEVSKVMKGANHNVVGLHLNMFSGQRGRIATIKLGLQELLQPVTAGEGSFTTDLTIKETDTSIYLIITPFSLIDKCVESNKGILAIWDKISGFATSNSACILFIVITAGKITAR